MSSLTIALCLLLFVYDSSAIDIMPELKRNILNSGYGVNFKYEGMLSHSFDWFYIVMKFKLPKTKDLRLVTFKFDFECSYANHTSTNTNYAKLLKYCMKITPYAWLYQRQIQYYNQTAYDTLTDDIGKILPEFPTDNRHKWGVILASILGSIASKVIGLAYEGISSFLHHKRHKALHKAVAVMNKKTDIQHNRIHHLEDTMIMYGVYNSDTLTDLIDTIHRMQNFTTWNEKTFAGKLWLDGDICSRWRHAQLCHKFCTILDYCKRKVHENVWEIYWGTEIIFKGNKSFIKRVSAHFSIASIKTRENPMRSKNSNCKI